MEGLFNIDWNHLTYSSFSSLMCCFLMVTTIWDNPRNIIKNAFNSLFEGLKNKMHEQHAQLTHLNPAKKMEHIEYMDGKYEEMACLLENDLEKALKIYKYAAVVACMLANRLFRTCKCLSLISYFYFHLLDVCCLSYKKIQIKKMLPYCRGAWKI